MFAAYVSCDNTISVCITVPPTAPLNVTATVLSATSVSLTWSHPSSDGGVDITNYIITYRSSAEDQMTVETNSVSLTIELFDLTPYTAYEFLASAENAIGTGPASVTVQAMTLVGGKCTIIQQDNLSGFIIEYQFQYTYFILIYITFESFIGIRVGVTGEVRASPLFLQFFFFCKVKSSEHAILCINTISVPLPIQKDLYKTNIMKTINRNYLPYARKF